MWYYKRTNAKLVNVVACGPVLFSIKNIVLFYCSIYSTNMSPRVNKSVDGKWRDSFDSWQISITILIVCMYVYAHAKLYICKMI